MPIWQIIEGKDDLVGLNQQWASNLFFKSLHANIELDVKKDWKHVWAIDDPTQQVQGDCGTNTKSHFCGYDTAGKILKHLLFNLPKANVTEANFKGRIKDYASKGILKAFNQKEFITTSGDPSKTEIKDVGYVYYPHNCLEKMCNLHISLHGCFGGIEFWATEGTELINYAASNDLILLFPMVVKCYDTDGKTGEDYNNKHGA